MTDTPNANRFDFYEVVTVVQDPELDGEAGVILGMVFDPISSSWQYAVSVESKDSVWTFYECQLTTTGEFRRRADVYDGTSIRVHVDPETGDGNPAIDT